MPLSAERPSLVFVTQTVDAEHPALGRVVGMIRALGERSCLTVIANEVGLVPSGLPASVLSLGKESGAGRLEKTARYLRLLRRIGRGGQCDGLVAHMCPEYLALAAPACRRYGIGTYLWYTHPYVGRRLRFAERFADEVATSLDGSYPGASPRVNVIGHAIELEQFPRQPLPARPPLVLLALGRLSPVKNLPLLVDAVARTSADVRLRIVGPAGTADEVAHREELSQLVRRRGVEHRVSVEGPVPASETPGVIASAHVLVNTTRSGSADKVVFETMASGRPVLTTNTSFRHVLRSAPELLVPATAEAVAEQIGRLAALSDAELSAVGQRLRATVAEEHSVEHWAEAILGLVQRRRRPTAAR